MDERGWVAEIAIPFLTVGFAAENGVWGFEAERLIRRKNEEVRWANPNWFDFGSDLWGKAGLDLFYKLHPSVTTLLTLNTDFMEAPVDEFRTELTRFPPFFPERRDFFP